jgi:hypothetical protein
MPVRRVLETGGLIAGFVLVGFGIAVIVLALGGRSTVSHELSQQNIVGSSDMTPQAIKAEAAKARLENVADEAVNYGVVDEIARRVWLTGGKVLAVRSDDIPGNGSVAAILRYAV